MFVCVLRFLKKSNQLLCINIFVNAHIEKWKVICASIHHTVSR